MIDYLNIILRIFKHHLYKMNEKYSDMPWNLTFSYGRALQYDALNNWKGKNISK